MNTLDPVSPDPSVTVMPAVPTVSTLSDAHPYFGQGGSYSFDPSTGQTTLIERAGFTPEQAATSAEATGQNPTSPTQE